MEAGRELDVKIAEALGWNHNERLRVWITPTMYYTELPEFSTTWEGMGLLVDEAKKHELYLEYSHALNGGYYGVGCVFKNGEYQIHHEATEAVSTAAHAVSLIFLQAKGIAI